MAADKSPARFEVLGEATDVASLARVIARRRYQLRVPSRALDKAVGVADGYVSKLECGVKTLGTISLPLLLEGLGLRLVVLVDNEKPLPVSVQRLVGDLSKGAKPKKRQAAAA